MTKLVPCDIQGTPHSFEFGQRVAISDRYMAVYMNNWNRTGAVYVYEKQGGSWPTQPNKIQSPTIKTRGTFSSVLGLSDNRLVVGGNEYRQINREYTGTRTKEYEDVHVYVRN